jgi:hypothetical protein
MADITIATLTGWIIIALVAYILGEYTSVFARAIGGARYAGRPIMWFKGRPARQTALGFGGFFAGIYAGGFLWSLLGSLFGASVLAGGAVAWGLTIKETIVVFLAALAVGLALYTGAAAEGATDAD